MTTAKSCTLAPDDVNLGRAKLPPGYRVVWCDDHTLWVAPDGTEGAIHWNKWASFRGAWAHYRQNQAKETNQ